MSPLTLILLFLVIANLPWFTERFLLVIPKENKSVLLRLLELVVYYFISLIIATVFESRFSGGEVHPQSWEFFVTTFSLFLVLSVPGVVYRYQWIPLVSSKK